MDTKTVSVNGVELNVNITGRGNPVMVVGSATYYPRTFSESLQRKYRWVFADCRLYAPTPAGFDMATPLFERMADDLEALRKKLDLGKVTILGHSIHGLTALEYARRYPESVTGAVMICTPPYLGAAYGAATQAALVEAGPERLAIVAQRWQAFGGQEKLATMHPDDTAIPINLNNGPLYWYDMNFDAAPLWAGVRGNATLLFHLMLNQAAGYDLGIEPRVNLPVFVGVGRYDFVSPYTMWNDAERAKLSRLTLHLFEKSGHTPQLEEPAVFDQKLIAWLDAQ